jgi:glycosyltransferase involved in cell wall biosynthesis
MPHWTILTCEYPPGCGGVGDYTAQVAAALAAAGDKVTVVCPPRVDGGLPARDNTAVEVVVLNDTYGRAGRQAIDARLDAASPTDESPLLVQYVPTGFGLRGANIPFSRWLQARSERPNSDIRVMFHEPYFEYTWSPLHQNALAAAERVMAKALLRAASRVYLSTDTWRRYLAPHGPARGIAGFETLPIPSAIPRCDDVDAAKRCRRDLLGRSQQLVGHFGTFGAHIAPMLSEVVSELLIRCGHLSAVFIGAGSDRFADRLKRVRSALSGRVHGTGRLDASAAAATIAACDLLLQPYPDGVTTRRTSTMAGLINGRPILTTSGHLTEPVWNETHAVALVNAHDTTTFVAAALELLECDNDRSRLAERGERTYAQRFTLARTIRSLRRSAADAAA